LFDSVSANTFTAIDDLFSELKELIEKKVVIQIGEGVSSTFKVAKK
jgi:type I restriction enzyme S subunit